MSEKLQKVLARAGVGSRREMELWISDGRIAVNGAVAKLGDRVTDDARITVDGRPLARQRIEAVPRRVIVYHKPEGEVCSRSDSEGRTTVFASLPRTIGRWISVGRLDLNTSGLLLFTTDGELANRLMHPSSEIEREYAVRILGEVNDETIGKLLQGVVLDDGPARFQSVVFAGGEGANRWYHVVLKEGRRREVRRLWESQGLTVSRLIRLRYGPVQLPPRLRPGHWQELDDALMQRLLQQAGLKVEKQHSPPVQGKPRPNKTRHGSAQGRRRHNRPTT